MIATALAVAWESSWLPYFAGGSDCSGAMYFVMRKAGLGPPRGTGVQMEWLGKNDRLHRAPGAVPASKLLGHGTPPGLGAE
jgi:cell wall-associated NlpC family hydrolase